jgi:hypothetical protein
VSALTVLDRLVGMCVRVTRSYIPLEELAYGRPGEVGGEYYVVSVGPLCKQTFTHEGQMVELIGRQLVGDEGMAEFITADTRIEVLDDPHPEFRHGNEGLQELKAGIYRHYKGHLYQVTGYVANSTNGFGDLVMVAYTALQLDGSPKPGPRSKVREAREFFDWVWPDGSAYYYAQLHTPKPGTVPHGVIPRFSYLGPAWTPEMSA